MFFNHEDRAKAQESKEEKNGRIVESGIFKHVRSANSETKSLGDILKNDPKFILRMLAATSWLYSKPEGSGSKIIRDMEDAGFSDHHILMAASGLMGSYVQVLKELVTSGGEVPDDLPEETRKIIGSKSADSIKAVAETALFETTHALVVLLEFAANTEAVRAETANMEEETEDEPASS